ncbi:hypothetical protein BG262_04570 [Floricoccus penangensis]|uniref:Uncharacterized protein n=1 Tax=Floricoccus penangensis TaxID=1859475 RepID=A0A9Q5NZ63_9LACT|nr:CppA N-terminal domain-containing protein [Floricoccus penangensis]OFI46294.1 hypothetical protein BG262_04570 [Floricoccus penangensis]
MNKIINDINNFIPTVRVNNRDLNIDFYQQFFGFKNLYEENAIAILGGYANREEKLILEESPSMWTRKVSDGHKKLNRLSFKAKQDEILELMKKHDSLHDIKYYKGKNGYAFEASSPENDLILIHSEDNLSNLERIERNPMELYVSDINFRGLSVFSVSDIDINVPDVDKAMEFYIKVFGIMPEGNTITLPFVRINFIESNGADLLVDAADTWDLEILELNVPEDFDLKEANERFEAYGYETYVDKPGKILSVKDNSGIETWFQRSKVKS